MDDAILDIDEVFDGIALPCRHGQPGGKLHDPAIHEAPHEGVLKQWVRWHPVDARVKRGHDGGGVETAWIGKPDSRGSSPRVTRRKTRSSLKQTNSSRAGMAISRRST